MTQYLGNFAMFFFDSVFCFEEDMIFLTHYLFDDAEAIISPAHHSQPIDDAKEGERFNS
jgi:hypothetical protein